MALDYYYCISLPLRMKEAHLLPVYVKSSKSEQPIKETSFQPLKLKKQVIHVFCEFPTVLIPRPTFNVRIKYVTVKDFAIPEDVP